MTRHHRILSAMQSIASWPHCTAEAVAQAAIQADDEWLWAQDWTLSMRSEMYDRIRTMDCGDADGRVGAISDCPVSDIG